MPLPRRLARVQQAGRRTASPGLVAGWMPGLAIVTHAGRVSGHRVPDAGATSSGSR